MSFAKSVVFIIAVTASSACSTAPVTRSAPLPNEGPEAAPRIGAADIADSATTAAGLTQTGLVEANPLLGWAGPLAPVVGLGVKYGAKAALVEAGMPAESANFQVERGSAFGACANIATIAGAAAPPALVAGLVCGIGFTRAFRPDEPATARYAVVPHDQVEGLTAQP